MKAAQLQSYGGEDSLVVNTVVPQPVVAENQVLVRVKAVSGKSVRL